MRYIKSDDKFFGNFVGNLAIKEHFKQNWIHVGESVNYIPKDYVILDVETTGFQPDYDEIIEIACIKYRNFKAVDRFSTLVRPNRYYDYHEGYVDNFVSELTGITNNMLEDAPLFSDIADKANAFLADDIIIGHNVSFDIRFLRNYLFNLEKRHYLTNDYLDTLTLSRKLIESNSHTLEDMILMLNLERIRENRTLVDISFHRALSDCVATQELYLWLNSIVIESGVNITELLKPKYSHRERFDLTALKPEGILINKDSPFYGKNIVFTGKLKRFLRKEAGQIVANVGGYCQNGVNKNTDFLVVGDLDFMGEEFYKSTKMKKVEALIAKGKKIEVVSETTFYDLIAGE